MTEPQDVALAKKALGAELARRREAAGHKQRDLASLIHVSRSTVASVETGHQIGPGGMPFWSEADRVLNAGGALVRGFQEVLVLLRRQRDVELRATTAVRAEVAALSVPDGAGLVLAARVGRGPDRWAMYRGALTTAPARAIEDNDADAGIQPAVRVPPGRFFGGLHVEARVYPAAAEASVMAAVPVGFVNDHFLLGPRRGLVAGITSEVDGPRPFAVDTRHARYRLLRSGPGARLPIPYAYAMDDLTFGVLWAAANMDEALLSDDSLLAGLRRELRPYEVVACSAVGRDVVAELSRVSQLWVGSDFCGRHVLRHLQALDGVPMFWGREQRGEEASTWLLFAHRLEFLRAIAGRHAGVKPRFGWCIPEAAVAASPRPERILLLLTAAVIESHGICVDVCVEPEYAEVEGFVLTSSRVIVANWVGADGVWHADVTAHRPSVNNYVDVARHAQEYSIVAGDTPRQRMRALADHLDLDWSWLVPRCAEIAQCGWAGLVAPRSRLLSVAGLDRACTFVAGNADAQ